MPLVPGVTRNGFYICIFAYLINVSSKTWDTSNRIYYVYVDEGIIVDVSNELRHLIYFM